MKPVNLHRRLLTAVELMTPVHLITTVVQLAIPFAAAVFLWRWRVHHPLQTWENFLQVVALVITTGGLLFQLCDSIKQRQKTEEIARQMSTHYIGEFPRHVDDITEVVGHAHHEFRFLADCVDYSSFSYPEGHSKLNRAIKEIRKKGVCVKMLVYADAAPITRSSPLFEETWDTIKKSREYKYYFGVEFPKKNVATESEFSMLLKEDQEWVRQDLVSRGVTVLTLPELETDKVGPFLWIADDQDAVFLLLAPGAKTSRVAFRTRDSKIIDSLKSIFDSKWKAAERTSEAECAKAPSVS